MTRILPECPDSDPSDRSAGAVLLRQEPDEEEEDEEDEGDDNEDDDDEGTDEGYSVSLYRGQAFSTFDSVTT